MSIEITNEPAPAPRPGGKIPVQELMGGIVGARGGAHIQFVEGATGKVVNEITTPDYAYVNERIKREERKY